MPALVDGCDVILGNEEDTNGKYDFIITDNGGNTFTLHTEVSNIDYLAPEAEYTVTPAVWTNRPAVIHVTATDPEPEDGYAPSGGKSITRPDGTVVDLALIHIFISETGKYHCKRSRNAYHSGSVSYTHLDVYKRQGISSANDVRIIMAESLRFLEEGSSAPS